MCLNGLSRLLRNGVHYKRGTLLPLSDNINDITRCHCVCLHISTLCLTLLHTHAQTHTLSLYLRTRQTALSSTCLQCYLPQSLPGSQIPTVSAHVNSEITGHAHTHICFAFKRVISVCTQAIRSFSPPLVLFFFLDKPRKQSR